MDNVTRIVPNLNNLPTDVIRELAGHLSAEDLKAFELVNTRLHQEVKPIWEALAGEALAGLSAKEIALLVLPRREGLAQIPCQELAAWVQKNPEILHRVVYLEDQAGMVWRLFLTPLKEETRAGFTLTFESSRTLTSARYERDEGGLQFTYATYDRLGTGTASGSSRRRPDDDMSSMLIFNSLDDLLKDGVPTLKPYVGLWTLHDSREIKHLLKESKLLPLGAPFINPRYPNLVR